MDIDIAALATLSRPALQKLAKEYQIKANLKSEVIIQLLTLRLAEYTNAPQVCIPSADSHEFELGEGNPFSFAPPPEDDESRNFESHIKDPHGFSSSLFQGKPFRKSQSPSVNSTYTFATPESSIAGTPEPEAAPGLLENTVEIIAEVAGVDQRTVEKIAKLRLAVGMLHGKTADMRSLLKAERAMRERLEDFCAHWMKINPRWTYDEVWAGELRVRNMRATREVTTSDEEEVRYQNDELPRSISPTFTNIMADPQPQASGVTLSTRWKPPSSKASRTLVTRKKNLSPLDTPPILSATASAVQEKRSRLDDDEVESEARYQPRPRSKEHHLSVQATISKGKGRMSADEVEEMYQENQPALAWHPNVGGQHELAVALGLVSEDGKQDHAPAPDVPH